MTDYLSNLVSRNHNKAEVIRPKLPYVFEPPRPPSEGPIFGYAPKAGIGAAQRYEDDKEHKDIDLPIKPQGQMRERKLPLDLYPPGTMLGNLIEDGSDLELRDNIQESEYEMEKVVSDIQPIDGQSMSENPKPKTVESEEKMLIGPGTKLGRLVPEETQPDRISKDQEFAQSIKSMNPEFRAESKVNHDPEEVNGLSDTHQFRPDTYIHKNSTKRTLMILSKHDNEKNAESRVNRDAPEVSQPLVSQQKSLRHLPVYPGLSSIAGRQINPLTVSSREELLLRSNSISFHARAYHQAGRQTARDSQADARHIADSKPEVKVTIGRIEVRAVQQPPLSKPSRRASGAPSLDEYLRKRAKGDIQ